MFSKRLLSLFLTLPIFFLALREASATNPSFESCLNDLKRKAAASGISQPLIKRALNVKPDLRVISAMNRQPEFTRPIWDYLSMLVSEKRISAGKRMLAKHGGVLSAAEQKYGVDKYVILAVWGVESNYGSIRGKWPLPQALATAACLAPRRRDFFRNELISALRIVERGDLPLRKLQGSWAGAFGHTQFIPSTYLRTAVDGDGDGRRNLVDSIPDAIFSTANYLSKSGWKTEQPWGYEVILPRGYISLPTGKARKLTFSQWKNLGFKRINAQPLKGKTLAKLFLPAGREGPAFLICNNYHSIYAYNNAHAYTLAISTLSDHLKGKPGVVSRWPTHLRPLSRKQVMELQRRLADRGYEIGKIDGVMGAKTRRAIRRFEYAIAMPASGVPTLSLLQSLRGRRSTTVIPAPPIRLLSVRK